MPVIRSSRRPGLILLVLALALMAAGVWRGEVQSMLRKSLYICMECIGLG